MEDVCNFIFELGQLRRVKHEGWKLFGKEEPESVAEHSLRAAQIGFVLAKLEGYKRPEEVCAILVFHDIGECRIGDLHKVARRYVESDEERAVRDQMEKLKGIGKDIFELWKQAETCDTEAGAIAKDADFLEMAATAKEYVEIGFTSAQDWIERIYKKLQTKSAKRILEKLKTADSNSWWVELKKT
jgi:putative hydrolase of HD superfamily